MCKVDDGLKCPECFSTVIYSDNPVTTTEGVKQHYCDDCGYESDTLEVFQRPKTKEKLGETLCTYCPLPDNVRGVHCYGGDPIMCEGSNCDEAYDRYLEEYNVNEEV